MIKKRILNIIMAAVLVLNVAFLGISGASDVFADTEDLSVTVIGVEQSGQEIEKKWSDTLYNYGDYVESGYYYELPLTSAPVTLSVLVDGMEDGKSYKMLDEHLTSANNGQIIESTITLYSGGGSNGNITWYVSLCLDDGSWMCSGTTVVFRALVVGDERIKIDSVVQDGAEIPFKDGTYSLPKYDKPMEITYTVNGLKEGYSYSTGTGSSYIPETDNEEKTFTITAAPMLMGENSSVAIGIYGYKLNEMAGAPHSGDSVHLSVPYKIIDDRYEPFNRIMVQEIIQGGNKITPECVEAEFSWDSACTFSVNDVQELEVKLITDSAIDGQEYLLNGEIGNMYVAPNYQAYTGSELKQGVTLKVTPKMDSYGVNDFRVSFKVSDNYTSGVSTVMAPNDEMQEMYVKLNIYKDANIPRFTTKLVYDKYPDIELGFDGNGMVSPLYHDQDRPLAVEIKGEGYQVDAEEEINIVINRDNKKVKEYAVKKTGAELLEGTKVVLSDFVMDFPTEEEFNNDSESAYYIAYVRVGEMTRTVEGYYDYGTNVTSLVVMPDGSLMVSDGGGGAAGPRISMAASSVSRSALGNEDGIDIYYVTTDYEESAKLDYEVYVGDLGDAPFIQGNLLPEGFVKIKEGKITGKELNDGIFKVNLKNADNYVQPAIIMMLKHDGRIVSKLIDQLQPWDGAGIVSGEAHSKEADKELYLQYGAQAYYVPNGSTVQIKYTGINFENDKEYTVENTYAYIQYCSAEKPDGLNAWSTNGSGEYCWGDIANEGIVGTVKISGEDLNEGKLEFEVPYDGLEGADSCGLIFSVLDEDGMMYHGAYMYLHYIDANDMVASQRGYKINNSKARINGISQKTKASEVIEDLEGEESNRHVKILKDENEIGADSNVGTNMTVRVVDEYDRAVFDVTAVVNGDLTGSGEIDSVDLLRMRRQLISGDELEGAYLEAADVMNDDAVDSLDLLQMRRHLIGVTEIK